MKKYSKGFTLIELLVVIAIIGILSSVVLASLNTARQKARDSRRISDVKSIQLALELYANDNGGKYPSALSTLVPTYMSKIPTDPGSLAQAGSGAYWYAAIAGNAGTQYHLGADLETSGSNPSNDANCDSTVANANTCFNPAIVTNGFVGTEPPTAAHVGAAAVYDQKN